MARTTGSPVSFSRKANFRGILSGLFILSLLFILPHTAHCDDPAIPDTKTVEATGVAAITAGNAALARDSALADAQRNAVEQAVGTMVSSETLVENFVTLKDNVYTKSQGYIKDYSVIKESQDQALYNVTIKATVSTGLLKDDLSAMGLLHKKAERPRVLFMIAEKNIGHKFFAFWWWGKSEYKGETVDMSSSETALKEIFINKGFNVVDITGTTGNFKVSDAYRIADITKDGAKQIGRGVNAEVVVFGKAIAKEGPRTEGSSVGSYLADITAQAVRVDDGVVLASSRGHGVARHISEVTGGSEALSRAASEMADKLVDQIMAKWSGSNSVTVRLSGVTDYARVTEFKNALMGRIRGIQAVYQRKFEGGVATLEIESKVPAQNIADEVQRLGMPVQVVNATANSIEIRMK